MIYFEKAISNIRIHKYKSTMTSIICMLMVLLFHLYLANLNSDQRQLSNLAEIMPISARIVNLNGSQEVDLAIKDEIILQFQKSQYIENLILTVRSVGSIGVFEPEEWPKHLELGVLSTNTLQAVVDLKEQNITWKEGYDSDFLQLGEAKCIVSQKLMEEKRWNLGDNISLGQYYYHYGIGSQVFMDPLATSSFEIVGYVEFPQDAFGTTDILLPFEAERNIFLINNIPFCASSASFYLREPLKLNEFKKEMKSINLLPVMRTAQFSHQGNALSLRDSTFITAASKLRQGMDILIGFSVLILAIVIGIGYIASFLLLQGRKEEIAIMRSLGLSNKACFLMMMIESVILAATGIVVGSLAALISLSAEMTMIAIGVALALGCYIAGTCAALVKIARISVMDALTRID